jgi:mannose-1-phosphate guanylyltransferase
VKSRDAVKAVILAGGLGTRLQPYTFFIPKAMLPLGNKPLLEHIISWLTNRSNKIDHVVICVSYLHRTIEDYFEDGRRFGVKIDYARADRPLATAGQLKTAEKFLSNETFVCLYGDSIYEFDIHRMIREHRKSKAFLSMALLRYRTNLRYGVIEVVGKSNRVSSWNEKPEITGLINIGCYVIEPEFFKLVPKSSAYGMDEAVKKALNENKIVRGFTINSVFVYICDKKTYLDEYKKYVKKLGKI